MAATTRLAMPERDGSGIYVWGKAAGINYLRAPSIFQRGADVLALLKERGYEVVGDWVRRDDGGVAANVRAVEQG